MLENLETRPADLVEYKLPFYLVCAAICLFDCQLVSLHVKGKKKNVCAVVSVCEHRCVCGGKEKQAKGACFPVV